MQSQAILSLPPLLWLSVFFKGQRAKIKRGVPQPAGEQATGMT
jgi:hypothetical protein